MKKIYTKFNGHLIIYTKEDRLIIEVPLKAQRSNPYDEDYHTEMDNIVAVIEPQSNCNMSKMGFCYNIDMEYKGKGDQHSDFFYIYDDGDEKDFIKLCKKLKLEIITYPACVHCGGAMMSCFTADEKGWCHEECSEK